MGSLPIPASYGRAAPLEAWPCADDDGGLVWITEDVLRAHMIGEADTQDHRICCGDYAGAQYAAVRHGALIDLLI